MYYYNTPKWLCRFEFVNCVVIRRRNIMNLAKPYVVFQYAKYEKHTTVHISYEHILKIILLYIHMMLYLNSISGQSVTI